MGSGEGIFCRSLCFKKHPPHPTFFLFFPSDSGNAGMSFSSPGVYVPNIDLLVKRQKTSKFSPRGFGLLFLYYQKPRAITI